MKGTRKEKENGKGTKTDHANLVASDELRELLVESCKVQESESAEVLPSLSLSQETRIERKVNVKARLTGQT